MEDLITDTGTNLATFSPNRHQGIKERSAGNTTHMSHDNGHCYPGPHESLDENSEHHQGTYQDITQGTVQQG